MNRVYFLGLRRFADPTGMSPLQIRVGRKADRKPFSALSRFVATCGSARADLLNLLQVETFALLLPPAQFLELLATRRGARKGTSAIRGILNFGVASSVGLGSSSHVHACGLVWFTFHGTNSCGDIRTRSSSSRAVS